MPMHSRGLAGIKSATPRDQYESDPAWRSEVDEAQGRQAGEVTATSRIEERFAKWGSN